MRLAPVFGLAAGFLEYAPGLEETPEEMLKARGVGVDFVVVGDDVLLLVRHDWFSSLVESHAAAGDLGPHFDVGSVIDQLRDLAPPDGAGSVPLSHRQDAGRIVGQKSFVTQMCRSAHFLSWEWGWVSLRFLLEKSR